ncbi:MAG: hypothetical protein M3N82_18645 [Pseudomonadota bacterium]|nr:hypothetical protein [Pseudomonadota bacterium]
MSETTLSNATSSEHFNRAAAALKAAERDAHAAIDSAVDGLASAYGEAKPLLSRVGQQARDYASNGYDAARERAAALKERSQQAVESTRGYVSEEPIKSLLIAAAVGAAVIALVEVVRIRRNR